MADSTSALKLDLATFVSITMIVVSCLQLAFFWYQRQHKNCGWEVVYVTAVEPLTYFLGIVFPEARVGLANGSSIYFLRYAGWLCTCPVLLILLTNLPRGKFKRPQDTLTALVANQLMIVFGVAAIFYTGAAKAILFILGVMAGALVAKTALNTFLNASASFPDHAKTTLWLAAAAFFVGWLVFPVMWLVGPEGYGSVEFGISQLVHAFGDLISKNTFGFISWYLRFKIIKKWESEQKRLKREAEQKAKDDEARSAAIDPAYDLAYNGGFGPQYSQSFAEPQQQQLVIRRTPGTIAACTSLLDRARKFVEDREVRVLIVEEDGMNQKSILEAFEDVEECTVKPDILFSIEDVPRLFERGAPHYAAVFINADLLKHLVSLNAETVAEMELDIYTTADFRDEHKELRRSRRRAIRRVRKLREARQEAAGFRDEDDEDDEQDYLYDSDEDARAAEEDGDDLHPTQKLFGARTVIAYRLGKGRKKANKDDKSTLGFNVFLRHPTDPTTLSRVFSKLATQMGVVPVDMAEDEILEYVLGTVETTALAAASSQEAGAGYSSSSSSASGYGGADPYSGGGAAMIAVPRQNSSMNTLGMAFHGPGMADMDDSASVASRMQRPPPAAAVPQRHPGAASPPGGRTTGPQVVVGRVGSHGGAAASGAGGLPPVPPPQGRTMSQSRRGVADRQNSFGREASTALDAYEEAVGSSTEQVEVEMTRGGRRGRRR